MQRPNLKRVLKCILVAMTGPGLLVALMSGAFSDARAQAQGDLPQSRLEIAGLDIAQFPTVGVNLIVTDRQSRPLRELDALRLRENGAPIADYEITPLIAGTDLFIVVDANSRIQEADDESGLTRLQKVKDSILSYGGSFMDLAERDRVTVIVPGGDGPRVLVEEAAAPADLIDAVRPYDAGRLPESPVVEMLALALERASGTKEAGRFQAIVLYTDAAGINEGRLSPLIEQAQEQETPIFVLLLGGGATPSESAVQTASALTTPTRGFFVPMPAASDSSEVFQVIADNGVQSQILYRSNVRRSGVYSLAVTLEERRDETTLDLELAPPEVHLQGVQESIERAGTQPDTPLTELQPAVQPVVAQVSWPDGLPRRLQGASLLANGRTQEAPFFGGEGTVQFDWRIADLDAGRYELTVLVTDTLGLAAQSEVQTVTILLARPEPLPSPSPAPTPQPLQELREFLPPLPSRNDVQPYLAPVGGALIALALGVIVARRLRNRRARADVRAGPFEPDIDETEGEAATRDTAATGVAGATGTVDAYLEPLTEEAAADGKGALALAGGNVSIGSAQGEVKLYLADRSVSSLHARIRRHDDAYWLYDEGSQLGTFLNHERLGLAAKQMRDGDEVQLGRVRLRFRIVKASGSEVAHVGRVGEDDE